MAAGDLKEPKQKVRQDIKAYEHFKLLKGLATAGGLASAGVAGIGSFKGNPWMKGIGLTGAFTGGFARGWAKKEEHSALNRVKRFYDLRERPQLFNINAVIPGGGGREKTAVVGGAAEAISGIMSALAHTGGISGFPESMSEGARQLFQYLHMPSAAITAGAASIPMAIDLAALPAVGKYVEQLTREHAHVAAKQKMGLSLTPAEELLRAKSLEAVAQIKKTEAMKDGLYKSLVQWRNKYRGPKATGGQLGERAGDVLKELHKMSPTMANAALGAIKDDKGFGQFVGQLELRKKTYGDAAKILDSTIDEIPGLRGFMRFTGKGGQNMLAELIETPESAKVFANAIKKNVKSGVSGVKGGLLAAGLLGVGSLLGQYRSKHPLAKGKLPGLLAEQQNKSMGQSMGNEKTAGFWAGFEKQAYNAAGFAGLQQAFGQNAPESPAPSEPPPQAPADVGNVDPYSNLANAGVARRRAAGNIQ